MSQAQKCNSSFRLRLADVPRSRSLRAATLLMLAFTGSARAQVTAVPYSAAQYEYDSNVFALSSRSEAKMLDDGDGRRADEILRAIAGLQTGYQWQRQDLHAQVEGRRLEYDQFDQLDHYEYLLAAGLDWKLYSNIEGDLNVRQERRLVAYADRDTTQLEIERERDASGTFKILLSPEWRLDAGANSTNLDSPLPAAPDFALKEEYGSLGLDYLGISKLATGFQVEYGAGSFAGIAGAAPYRQTTAELTGTYTVSGLSVLNAKLGYTRFQADGGAGGTTSGFAGTLGYTRTLSAKTDVNLQAFRRVESYIAGASSETDLGFSVTANWRPTVKLATSLEYQWTRSHFGALSTASGGIESNPLDTMQVISLNLNYQILSWMALHTFGEYHARQSNIPIQPDIAIQSYNEAIAGMELQLRLQ